MKSKILLFVLLMLFMPVTAMSDDTTEEPKIKKINEVQTEQKHDDGLITQVELHRIAINYYSFMFEEEHEWKKMKRKDCEKIIRNITPYKSDDFTIAYMVSYNPEGHALISALKNVTGPVIQNGNGIWKMGVKEGFLSIDDKRFTPFHWDSYRRKVEAYQQKKSLMTDYERTMWKQLNIPIDSFNERYDFDEWAIPPEWWLEKKRLQINKRSKTHTWND